MAYSLNRVEQGWEVQNGTQIKVFVPDLKDIEKVIRMLTPVKEKDEKETEKEVVMKVLETSKKALTAAQVMTMINANGNFRECKNIHMILSVLGRKKILKRRKNSSGVYVYSAK